MSVTNNLHLSDSMPMIDEQQLVIKKRALPPRIKKLADAYQAISMRMVNEHHTLTPEQWLELDTELEILRERLQKNYTWMHWVNW